MQVPLSLLFLCFTVLSIITVQSFSSVTNYSLTLATWLKEQFILADNGGKGRLNEKEVLSVVRQLNEQIPESVIKQRFKVGDSYSVNTSLNLSNIYFFNEFLS